MCRLIFVILVPIILKKLTYVFARLDDVKLISCEIQQGNPLPVFQWQVRSSFYPNWTSLSEVFKGKFKCNVKIDLIVCTYDKFFFKILLAIS